jgi:uncharacterized protein (DUF4415 family)
MISDEPDEDTDSLDDDAMVEALTGTIIPPSRASAGAAVPPPADWPPRSIREANLSVDAEVVAWFKANHPDWEKRISAVLRAWIATRPQSRLPGIRFAKTPAEPQ